MNDYERIARAIRHLNGSHMEQPDLAALAESAGLSPFHFHRLFSAWAGVTPKDFLQCLTFSHARELLRAGQGVLAASLESGLSGPGRLHDLCVNLVAASPGEMKSGGEGWTITVGFAETPFGRCLCGESPRGICHLTFPDTEDEKALAAIQHEWPRARLQRDDEQTARIATRIFERGTGREQPLRAYVRGTAFQTRVWLALLQIPAGSVVSYGQLAAAIGHPKATRAAGTAVGRNPISFLIPCHRVIRETGVLGNYRWDPVRKRAMLAWEAAAA